MPRKLACKRELVFFTSFSFLVAFLVLIAACTQSGPQSPAPAPSQGAVSPNQPPPSATSTAPAPGAGQLPVSVTVSKPANGTYFATGEQPVLTITLKDKNGKDLQRANDFAQLRLMAAGPLETADTVTAVKLLKTTADRSQTVHHYVDLATNPDVQVNNGVLTYKFAAVSDEKPGTYTAAVWAVLKSDGLQQAMAVADFQIGTAAVQNQVVDKGKCAACHLGVDSGKFYLHHIDPAQPGQPGNWALDSLPVQDCKTCHNNDGYAAYTLPTDGQTKVSDPIVLRVHGVHMGIDLKSPIDIDPANGIFKDYAANGFPADVRNCVSCHTDDRWKTRTSRLACGTCHDSTWFGDAARVPNGMKAHAGGPQADDLSCASCHPADTGGMKSVVEAHKASQPMNKVDVSMTQPANGKFYVPGEKPLITLVIRDDSGNPIDQTKVDTANFATANLLVSGNRANPIPVLSNSAKNGGSKLRISVANTKAAAGTDVKGWTFAAGDTFKIAVNTGPAVVLTAPFGLQTPAQVRDWLAANLKDVTVTATATNVTIKSNLQGAKSEIDIYDSNVTRIMGWKPGGTPIEKGGTTAGVTMDPYVNLAKASFAANDLRKLSDPLDYADPNVTRNANNITYQLYDVAGLPAGTYSVYTYVIPITGKVTNDSRVAIGFTTFQIGTATDELKVATNCTQCHGDTIWHLDEGPIHPEPFDVDYCVNCHDYDRPNVGNGFVNHGGTSLNGWSGYGAMPLSRRVHAVHFAHYLDYPQEIYANEDKFGNVIFPQDVRNCEKCHDPKGSQAWKEEPSRLACMGCHDSDADNAHAITMTVNPTPWDEWNVSKVEACTTCHGPGKEFAVDKVHNISNPFRPPYPRGEPQAR